jgi:hypothetical protein
MGWKKIVLFARSVFLFGFLMQRIRAWLRRFAKKSAQKFMQADISIHPPRKKVMLKSCAALPDELKK